MEPELNLSQSGKQSIPYQQPPTSEPSRYRGFNVSNLTPREQRKLNQAEKATQVIASTFRVLNLQNRVGGIQEKKLENARLLSSNDASWDKETVKPAAKGFLSSFSFKGLVSFTSFAAFIERIPLDYTLKQDFEKFQQKFVRYLSDKNNIPRSVIKYLLNEFFMIRNVEGSGSNTEKNEKLEKTVRDILTPGKWIEGIFKYYPNATEHHVRGVILDFPLLLGLEHPTELESQEAAKAYTFLSQLIATLPYGNNRDRIIKAFDQINKDLQESNAENFVEVLRDICLYAQAQGFHLDENHIPSKAHSSEEVTHLLKSARAQVETAQIQAPKGQVSKMRSQVELIAQLAGVNPLIAYCAKKNQPALDQRLIQLDAKIDQAVSGFVPEDRRRFVVDQLMTVIYEQVKDSADLDPDLEKIFTNDTKLYKILTTFIVGMYLDEMRDLPPLDSLHDLVLLTANLAHTFNERAVDTSARLRLIHRHLSEFDGDGKAAVIVSQLNVREMKDFDTITKNAIKEMLGTNLFALTNPKKVEEVREIIGQRNARVATEEAAAEAPESQKGGWGLGSLVSSGLNIARRVGGTIAATREWGLLPLPSEPKPIPSDTFKNWLETLDGKPLEASIYLMKAMCPVRSPEDEDHYIRFYRMMNYTFEKLGISEPAKQREFLLSFIFAKDNKPNSKDFISIIRDLTTDGTVLQNSLMSKILEDSAHELHPKDYLSVMRDLSRWFDPQSSIAVFGRRCDHILAICPTAESKLALNGYLMSRLSQVAVVEDTEYDRMNPTTPNEFHREEALTILDEEFKHPERLVLSILKASPDLPLETIRDMMKSVSGGLDPSNTMVKFVELLDEALLLKKMSGDRFEKFTKIFRNELKGDHAIESFEPLERLLVTVVLAQDEPETAQVVDTLLNAIEVDGFAKYIHYMKHPNDLIFDTIKAQGIALNHGVPLEGLKKVIGFYGMIAMLSADKAFAGRTLLLHQIKDILEGASSQDKVKKEYLSLEKDLIAFEAALLKPDGTGLNVETVNQFAGPLHLTVELSRILKDVQTKIVEGVESSLSQNTVLSPLTASITGYLRGTLATSRKYDEFLTQLRDPLVDLFHGVSTGDTIEFALKSAKDELLFDSALSLGIYRLVQSGEVVDARSFFNNALAAKREILRSAYLAFKQNENIDLQEVINQVCQRRDIPIELKEVFQKHLQGLVTTRIAQYQELGVQGKAALMAAWQMEISQDLPLELLRVVDRIVVQPHFDQPSETEMTSEAVQALLEKNPEIKACLDQMTTCGIQQKIQEEILKKTCLLAAEKINEFKLFAGFDDAELGFRTEWQKTVSSASNPVQKPLEIILCEPLMEILRPFIADPIVQLLRKQGLARGASLVTSIFSSNDKVEQMIRRQVDDVIRKYLTKGLAVGTNLKVDGWTLLNLIEGKLPTQETVKAKAAVKREVATEGYLKSGWNWLTTKKEVEPEIGAAKIVGKLIYNMLSIALDQVGQESGKLLQTALPVVKVLKGVATNKVLNNYIKPVLKEQGSTNFSDIFADVLNFSLPPAFPNLEEKAEFERKFREHMYWLIENKKKVHEQGEESHSIRVEFLARSKALRRMIDTCEYDYDADMYEEYRTKVKYDPVVQEFLHHNTIESYRKKTTALIPDDLAEKRFNTMAKKPFKPIISSLTPFMQGVAAAMPDYLGNDLTNVEIRYLLQRIVVLTLATQLEISATAMKPEQPA